METGLRRIPLTCAMNVRDLGGYPVSGCTPGQVRMTRFGRIFRSGLPGTPSPEDLEWLRYLDIRTVIDLRAPEETGPRPSGLAGITGITYLELPFCQGNQIPFSAEEIPLIYGEILEDRANICRVLTAVADAPGAVLYHCAAGKDRTGVITALLLLLVGVSVSDVLADYEVSFTYIPKWVRREILERMPGRDPRAVRSDMESMELALSRLFGQYPTVQAYLMGCGLSGSVLDRLRDKLLAPRER